MASKDPKVHHGCADYDTACGQNPNALLCVTDNWRWVTCRKCRNTRAKKRKGAK